MAGDFDPSIRSGSVQPLYPSPEELTSQPSSGKLGRFNVQALSSEDTTPLLTLQPRESGFPSKELSEYSSVEPTEGHGFVKEAVDTQLLKKGIQKKAGKLKKDIRAFKKDQSNLERSNDKRSKAVGKQKVALGEKAGKAQHKSDLAKLKVAHYEQLHQDIVRYKTIEMPQDREVTESTDGVDDRKVKKAAKAYHREHDKLSALETDVSKKLEKARNKARKAERSIEGARKQDKKDIKQAQQDAKKAVKREAQAQKRQEARENAALNRQQKALNKKDPTLKDARKTGAGKKKQTQSTNPSSAAALQDTARRNFTQLNTLITKVRNSSQLATVRQQIAKNPFISESQRGELMEKLTARKEQLQDELMAKKISRLPKPPSGFPE
ncbi:hypothetical protein ACWJJH_06245 [Endozoicomonadaceae bacterium StTr2]